MNKKNIAKILSERTSGKVWKADELRQVLKKKTIRAALQSSSQENIFYAMTTSAPTGVIRAARA